MQIGSHSFTFDHVFGSTGTPLPSLFERCVAPLVEGLFHGYNATVLAYGQVLNPVIHFRVCSDFSEPSPSKMICWIETERASSTNSYRDYFSIETTLEVFLFIDMSNHECLRGPPGSGDAPCKGSFTVVTQPLQSMHLDKLIICETTEIKAVYFWRIISHFLLQSLFLSLIVIGIDVEYRQDQVKPTRWVLLTP